MENQTQEPGAEQGNGQMPASAPAAAPADMATEKRDQDGVMIFLSYFGIFSLIPFLTVKDSDYIRWHSKQGLTMAATMFGLTIAGMIIAVIPVIGWIIAFLIPFVQLALLVVDIIAMVKAFGGERWKIPVISTLAEKW